MVYVETAQRAAAPTCSLAAVTYLPGMRVAGNVRRSWVGRFANVTRKSLLIGGFGKNFTAAQIEVRVELL